MRGYRDHSFGVGPGDEVAAARADRWNEAWDSRTPLTTAALGVAGIESELADVLGES